MQKRLYDDEQLNKLLVVNKPMFISSSFFLNKVKREYRNKKAGFSGTLDPFATGCLIVAFGQYAKLFKYFEKAPKKYKAVLWLGAYSSSFDIENVENVNIIKPLNEELIKKEIENLVGEISYTPPKFSAKKIDGKRAYELARSGEDILLKEQNMTIYSSKFINYNHPFITFEVEVSEGSYIRSLAQILVKNLNSFGTLCYLQRVNEGKFFYDNKKELNPLDYIDIPQNNYSGQKECFVYGKKIDISCLSHKENGKYLIIFDDFFSIIEVFEKEVKYLLNKVNLNKVNLNR